MIRASKNFKACKRIFLCCLLIITASCQTILGFERPSSVLLPYIKNSPNECYYLDEFMPVPDNIVRGKNGGLYLRYYTYKDASYKDWLHKEVILSFYSNDDRCWSLFEEYYVSN